MEGEIHASVYPYINTAKIPPSRLMEKMFRKEIHQKKNKIHQWIQGQRDGVRTYLP